MTPLGAPNLIGPAIGLFIIAIGTGGKSNSKYNQIKSLKDLKR